MGVAAFVVMITGEHRIHRGAFAGLFLATGWGFVGVGLWVWKQRPAGNIGPLMVAVGLSGLLKGLAFSNDSVVFAIASVGEVLIYAFLIQLLLSFPSGRLETRLDRLLVTIAYVNTTVVQLGVFLFTDSKAGCARCPSNPLLIEHVRGCQGTRSGATRHLDRVAGCRGRGPLSTLAKRHPRASEGVRPDRRRRRAHVRAADGRPHRRTGRPVERHF